MGKRQIILLLIAVALLGVTGYLFKGCSKTSTLQVRMVVRPNRVPADQRAALGPAIQRQPVTLTFMLSEKCRLQSVAVVDRAQIETNPFAHPLWKVDAVDASDPVNAITYGVPPRGMQPEVSGAVADDLEPGVAYRLLVRTSEQETTHDFRLGRRR